MHPFYVGLVEANIFLKGGYSWDALPIDLIAQNQIDILHHLIQHSLAHASDPIFIAFEIPSDFITSAT